MASHWSPEKLGGGRGWAVWGGERPAPVCAWDESERAATFFFFFRVCRPASSQGAASASTHAHARRVCAGEPEHHALGRGVGCARVGCAVCGRAQDQERNGRNDGGGGAYHLHKKDEKKERGTRITKSSAFSSERGGGVGEGRTRGRWSCIFWLWLAAGRGGSRAGGEGGSGLKKKKGRLTVFFFGRAPGCVRNVSHAPGWLRPASGCLCLSRPHTPKGEKKKGERK